MIRKIIEHLEKSNWQNPTWPFSRGARGIFIDRPRPDLPIFNKFALFLPDRSNRSLRMEREIEKVMTDLGIRYDQAYRMVRTRREFERRGPARATNWLK